MKKIRVNNLEEILTEAKKYADANPIRIHNAYRLNHTESYKKNLETGQEEKSGIYEGIGVKLNDKIDIYIEERKDPKQTKKFDKLFEELEKEISKIIVEQPKIEKPWSEIDPSKEWNYWGWNETNNWQTIKDDLRIFYYRHKKSIDRKKDFNNWVEIDENENTFFVCLGEKRKEVTSGRPEHYGDLYPSLNRDIHVTIKTAKDEIRNADLHKNILNLQKELKSYWNDLVNNKVANSQKKKSELTNLNMVCCSNCGIKKVFSNNEYCQDCGQRFSNTVTKISNNNSSSTKDKSGLFINLILISLIFLSVGLFCFYWMKKRKNNT